MGYLTCTAHSAVATDDSSLSNLKHFSYSDLESATRGFSHANLLGRGSHSSVYKALLSSGRLVAVKKPTPASPPSHIHNEIRILSQFRSPTLVNLLGFSSPDPLLLHPRPLLVLEFIPNGTLFHSLHSSPTPPPWRRRLRFALHISKALQTLHSSSPPVIHRDVKSTNVLLDTHHNAKLCDFGLALPFHTSAGVRPAGTIGYIDPCYLKPDQLSTKTDVFSFGILLLEIISGRKAMDVGRSPPCLADWAVPLIKKGKLAAVFDRRVVGLEDAVARRELADICVKCVRSCGERRPSMTQVVERLAFVNKLVSQWNGRLSALGCRPLNYAQPCAKSAIDVVDPRLKTVEY